MDVKNAKNAKNAKSTKSTKQGKSTGAGKPANAGKPSTARPARPAKPGTERARDEARQDGGPRYGGGPWGTADERGDRRFGHARVDDADPSELAPGEAENDDDDVPSAADPELADAEATGEIESGGQHAGMRRGEKPRKVKSQAR